MPNGRMLSFPMSAYQMLRETGAFPGKANDRKAATLAAQVNVIYLCAGRCGRVVDREDGYCLSCSLPTAEAGR